MKPGTKGGHRYGFPRSETSLCLCTTGPQHRQRDRPPRFELEYFGSQSETVPLSHGFWYLILDNKP